MQENTLAPNETMQVRELLTLNNLCLTKAVTMSPLVSDTELKDLMNNNIQTTQRHVKELRDYLEQKVATPSPVK